MGSWPRLVAHGALPLVLAVLVMLVLGQQCSLAGSGHMSHVGSPERAIPPAENEELAMMSNDERPDYVDPIPEDTPSLPDLPRYDEGEECVEGASLFVNADVAELVGDLILVTRYKDGHQVMEPIDSEEEGEQLAREAFKSPDVAVVFSAFRKEG